MIVRNAGHMVYGPAEAFTPEQFAELSDVNVLSTQRVNRSALPQLRRQGRGLLVWVLSSSVAGGTPPYLSPYFAAKTGTTRWPCSTRANWRCGVSKPRLLCRAPSLRAPTTLLMPGVPADKARLDEYEAGPYKGYGKKIQEAFAAIVPEDADVGDVAEAIAKVVDAPFGKLPQALARLLKALSAILSRDRRERSFPLPRLADAAAWAIAAASALEFTPEEILQALSTPFDPLVERIATLLQNLEIWRGSATQLTADLNLDCDASQLSRQLFQKENQAALNSLGLAVTRLHCRLTRAIEITKLDKNLENAVTPSQPLKTDQDRDPSPPISELVPPDSCLPPPVSCLLSPAGRM